MRIELTRPILMRFADKFNHPFSHVLYLVTCFLRVAISLLCRSQTQTISSPFTNYIGINLNMYLVTQLSSIWAKGCILMTVCVCFTWLDMTTPPWCREKVMLYYLCIFDSACYRHSNETVTLWKFVTTYKNMRRWMVELLRKSDHGIKIALVNSILIIKSINLL